MKKAFFLITISILMLVAGFWRLFRPDQITNWLMLVKTILMIIISAFGLFQGAAFYRTAKRGDPLKDELTQKINLKASSLSFFISMWGWILLMFVQQASRESAAEILSTGMLMMAGIYIIAIMAIRIKGLGNE